MIDYTKVKKVIGVGIGGGGMSYLAKFFHILGVEISGSDISENGRVKELKKLGINIGKGNPAEPFAIDTDIYLYTNALSDELKDQLKKMNPKITPVEVGELNEQLISDYGSGKMTDKVKSAFEKSGISPLYRLDYSKVLQVRLAVRIRDLNT